MKTVNLFTSVMWAQLACAIAQPGSLEECTAAEYKRLLFEVDMATFNAARDAQKPPCFDWTSDGCTNAKDTIWWWGTYYYLGPSCVRHDFGYRNHKYLGAADHSEMKSRVDNNFLKDMYDECGSGWWCKQTADNRLVAVGKWGGGAWNSMCYGDGTEWGTVEQRENAVNFIDSTCDKLIDKLNPSAFGSMEIKQNCYTNKGGSDYFEIKNTGSSSLIPRHDDCVHSLKGIFYACGRGGKSNFGDWSFEMKPMSNICESCYGGDGLQWGSYKEAAIHFVDEVCGKFSDQSGYQPEIEKYECRNFEQSGNRVGFYITNKSSQFAVLRREDCVAGLVSHINNCVRGGDTSYPDNWRFRASPAKGAC